MMTDCPDSFHTMIRLRQGVVAAVSVGRAGAPADTSSMFCGTLEVALQGSAAFNSAHTMAKAGTAHSVCRESSDAAQVIQPLLPDPDIVIASQSKRFRTVPEIPLFVMISSNRATAFSVMRPGRACRPRVKE